MSQLYPAHQPNHAHNLISNLEIDGETIVKINPDNNLVHLTYMCQKGGRDCRTYTRSDRFKNLKVAMEEENISVQICTVENQYSKIIVVENGGSNPGTWVHPDIAIDAAMWISPRFGLAVSRLVRSFLTGQVTTEQSQDAARQMQRAVQTVSREDHEFRMLKLNLKQLELKQELELKRFELESKRFAERILERSDDFEDVLVKQALRDYATNFFGGGGESKHREMYIDVPEILKQLGLSQKDSGRHGRMIARRFREHYERDPQKALKVVNGSQRECKVYSVDEVNVIKTWLT